MSEETSELHQLDEKYIVELEAKVAELEAKLADVAGLVEKYRELGGKLWASGVADELHNALDHNQK